MTQLRPLLYHSIKSAGFCRAWHLFAPFLLWKITLILITLTNCIAWSLSFLKPPVCLYVCQNFKVFCKILLTNFVSQVIIRLLKIFSVLFCKIPEGLHGECQNNLLWEFGSVDFMVPRKIDLFWQVAKDLRIFESQIDENNPSQSSSTSLTKLDLILFRVSSQEKIISIRN